MNEAVAGERGNHPTHHPAPARVLFVADGARGQVTRRARATLYQSRFERDGWSVSFADPSRESAGSIERRARDCDVVYLLKVASYPLVTRLRARVSARLVCDINDALWSPARRAAGWGDLDAILGTVDAVFGENQAVCEYARARNARVYRVPDSAQVETFDAVRNAARDASPGHDAMRSGKVVLGWVGSAGTAVALERIREPLLRLAERVPGWELRALGMPRAHAARALAGIPHSVLPAYEEDDMIREMLAMDIGLFPAPFDAGDYAARGTLKALLYMGAGVPPVCQRGGEIANVVQDGITGLLVDAPSEAPDAWVAALESLIRDPVRRQAMGAAALEAARASHSLEGTYLTLRGALSEVAALPPRAVAPVRSWPARILGNWAARFSGGGAS